ncbi:hypothetical protein BJY04DRAFT_60588 [Aspergillus karnatakaensis]|uniref:WD domain protein n=1 Tax=Aspergillus karnatakaensis TaxID=1810916 RepID=UPI003CCD4BBC
MSKRRHDDELPKPDPPLKRPRMNENGHQTDHLSSLSNEVLLHILSFLTIPSLLTCQRLSHRFYALAGDSELWKRQYFTKWVGPRARRLANSRRTSFYQTRFKYSPKVSTWLDHAHLDRRDQATSWKRQYQLRHNWSKGTCRVTKVEIPQPPRSPMLATFCAGFVFTADSGGGLRAWSAENPKICKAGLAFAKHELQAQAAPTALTATSGLEKHSVEIAVGFDDGRLRVYKMAITGLQLETRFSSSKPVNGAITAMASSYPYLMVVSKHRVLSLFKLPPRADDPNLADEAHLVASLKADIILSPMSLSVRHAGAEIIASVVYSFLHPGCGWALGVQELHFDQTGQQTKSRITTTVDTQHGAHLHPLPRARSGLAPTLDFEVNTPSQLSSILPAILHQDPPTCVSYSHPYLLTSHADNTLTVYLVVSTATDLYIKGGQRLWGHTSSVSAVQVSDRGKAVSVSSGGDEIRIWELENLVSSFGSQRMFRADKSIKVNPENHQRLEGADGQGVLSRISRREFGETEAQPVNMPQKLVRTRFCVGFDDERLLLLRDKDQGNQLLESYDFR